MLYQFVVEQFEYNIRETYLIFVSVSQLAALLQYPLLKRRPRFFSFFYQRNRLAGVNDNVNRAQSKLADTAFRQSHKSAIDR